MKAHLEPQTLIVRVFDDGSEYGDPYRWACEAVLVQPSVVELRGAMRAPTPAEWRAIYAALRESGYALAIWRRADGRVREWNLTKCGDEP